MQIALLIDDFRAMSSLFRFGVSPKRSADGVFTLYRVRHPQYATRQAVLLAGVPSGALRYTLTPRVGQQIKIQLPEESDDGTLRWRDDEGDWRQLDVLEQRRARRLDELVLPVAWRQEIDHDQSLVFWLGDEALLPELVRRSVHLGNDRIRVARLAAAEGGQEAALVRIDGPPYYLIAWAREQADHGAAIEVYYPISRGPGLYVEWGYDHPLEGLWRRAWSESEEGWLFFPGGQPQRAIEPPEWQDIYELVDFHIELEADELWERLKTRPEPFTITLRLAPRHDLAPTELLLLGEEDRPRLERQLALLDEQDWQKLEISVQQDPRGQRHYFLRETRRGEGLELIDFGGQKFSRYKGFDNLFLPVDMIVEPDLRRDQVKRLLELREHTLTVLMTTSAWGEGTNGGVDATRSVIEKRSFRPLTELIDYLVALDQEELDNALERSVFDLGDYLKAPSRPDLMPPGQRGGLDRDGRRGSSDRRGSRQDRASERDKSKKRRRQRRQDEAREELQPVVEHAEEAPRTPTEIERREAEVERRLIVEGHDPRGWRQLVALKEQRTTWAAAAQSAVEGVWSLHYPDPSSETEPLPAEALPDLQGCLVRAAQHLNEEAGEYRVLAELYDDILQQRMESPYRWVVDAIEKVRAVEPRMSKKLRWLAWREILMRNGDVRLQEEVREQILEELNSKGLQGPDVPGFIRERILTDPEIESAFSQLSAEDEAGGSGVMGNIEVVEQGLEALGTRSVREAGRSTLARILANIGRYDRCLMQLERAVREVMESIEPGSSTAPDTGGSAAEQLPVHQRLAELVRKQGARAMEGWQVLVLLNAWKACETAQLDAASVYKTLYARALETMGKYERDNIQKHERSIEERQNLEDVMEYLIKETRSFFSSRPLPEGPQRTVDALRQAHAKGQGKEVHGQVGRALELGLEELRRPNPEFQQTARLIGEVVEVLRKHRWDAEHRPVGQFDRFVAALPGRPGDAEASPLYFYVLRFSLARALMDLGRDQDALDMLMQTVRQMNEASMEILDFVDLYRKEALVALESAPRHARTEPLRVLMEGLVAQERFSVTSPQSVPTPAPAFEMPYAAFEIIQMLDQLLEAAVGRERLVLKRLREYEERDEYRIRYHLQRDAPAAAQQAS